MCHTGNALNLGIARIDSEERAGIPDLLEVFEDPIASGRPLRGPDDGDTARAQESFQQRCVYGARLSVTQS